jgi:hypothetical protein
MLGTPLAMVASDPLVRRARRACLSAAVMLGTCAGLIAAAALVPAPPVVVPLIALICLAIPLAAGHELSAALPVLRGQRAVARLRRSLDALPETHHPFGM